MYRYTPMDKRFVLERVAELRDQVRRRLNGQLSEDEFRPLRLMNGLYLQRHAYMLRVNIPYGLLNSKQMRTLGYVAERYDRGYGHITTRQNIQYNWIKLEEVPDLLTHLAEVEMHGIQSSGNCVRNITADPFAGVAHDEIIDVRPYCEILRQYFTLHPEFMYLPRKFKLALCGSREDRAATAIHDIGYRAVEKDGKIGFKILVGGGLGRTPRIGQVIREFLAIEDLISYSEAILRVYNLYGRRDNKYKARIKILVGELGIDQFRKEVEEEWQHLRHNRLDSTKLDEMRAYFNDVVYDPSEADETGFLARRGGDQGFNRWMTWNVQPHREAGYNIVHISLKPHGQPPGDIVTEQFYKLADIMDRYNQGYASTTYKQNMVLQYIRNSDLAALFDELRELGLATPNIGTINDMICCPGLEFCSLANASSISVSAMLNERFDDLDEIYDIGPLEIKMSGCINACGHHHVGHIGILGIDKRGEEFYQIGIGGSPGLDAEKDARVNEIIGHAVAQDAIVDTVEKLIDCYLERRLSSETFSDTVARLGATPFKEAVYA
jgi:sulfite reductase (NADPH) hemoprotein beta-component